LGAFVVLIAAVTILWVAPGLGSRRVAPGWWEAFETGSETPPTGVA